MRMPEKASSGSKWMMISSPASGGTSCASKCLGLRRTDDDGNSLTSKYKLKWRKLQKMENGHSRRDRSAALHFIRDDQRSVAMPLIGTIWYLIDATSFSATGGCFWMTMLPLAPACHRQSAPLRRHHTDMTGVPYKHRHKMKEKAILPESQHDRRSQMIHASFFQETDCKRGARLSPGMACRAYTIATQICMRGEIRFRHREEISLARRYFPANSARSPTNRWYFRTA